MYGALQFTKHFQCIHPLNQSLKPPWEADRTHIILSSNNLYLPTFVMLFHVFVTHTCSSWVLEHPLPPPLSFRLANSQPTLKIDAIAAFFKSSGILHSDWDVSLLYFFHTICTVAMITFYWNHLLAFLSLLTRLCTYSIASSHLIALTLSLSCNKDSVNVYWKNGSLGIWVSCSRSHS